MCTRDVLFLKKNYFVGAAGGLEAPALRRDRTGVVLKCTREHPNRVRKGAFLYTILFDDPPAKVERLPARGADGIDQDDENVEFLNDAAVWPEPAWVDENVEFLNDGGASRVVVF